MVVDIINGMTSFYGSTFVYSRFPTKFLYWFLSSVAPWSSTMVDTEEKTFEIYACRSAKNALFLVFSWIFKVSWEVLKKIWLERYIQLSFMRVCKYLNQRVRRIGCFKNKTEKKKHMKRLSFITQFKIELLLPFTYWRKVLGKCLHVYGGGVGKGRLLSNHLFLQMFFPKGSVSC